MQVYLNLVYDGDTASPDEAGNGLRHEHLQQYLQVKSVEPVL